jgi:hypothetical protein
MREMENLKGRYNAEDLGAHRRIILERVLGKYCGKVWVDWT